MKIKIDFRLQRTSTRHFIFTTLSIVPISLLVLSVPLYTFTGSVTTAVLLSIPIGWAFVGFLLILVKTSDFLISWSDRGVDD